MVKKSLLLILLATILAACSAAESADDVEAAVEAAFQEYAASLEAGDADRWAALWTEDGVQMPPGARVNQGKETILTGLRGALGAFSFSDMQINVQEVQTAGNWAYARGLYTVTYLPHDGSDPIPIDGKFMSIFQKQDDGTWKLHRDIFNSNVGP